MVSQDLGTYQYDLKLNAIPSSLERSMHFKVGLGNQQVQTFRFMSYSKGKLDYSCRIDSTEFSVEKTVSAPAGISRKNSNDLAINGGVEVCIDVIYEPSRLGDTRTQLIVSSPVGGDYVCPLFGHCTSPKPQGPIIIKAGTASAVQFKNVFSTNAVFNCTVDNPAFIIKPVETIPPKKVISLSIGYKPPTQTAEKPSGQGGQSATVTAAAAAAKLANSKTGKLIVTNPATNISWMYYLKYTS
jgi:hydrocephalus-inducing protein